MLFNSILYLTFAICSISAAQDRVITVAVNPDCTKCNTSVNGSYYNLVWVKLTGQNDDIHFLYSTLDSFTIMTFRTNISSKLSVNWENLLSKNSSLVQNSIKFDPTPVEEAGYVVPVVYEFNDFKGQADMNSPDIPNNASYWIHHLTDSFVWKQFNQTSSNSGFFEGKTSAQANGSFRFNVKFPGKDNERDKDLPHLLLNSEASSINLEIDSLDPQFKDSKFGVNFVLLSKHENMTRTSLRTLDDEYTPGTFTLWNIESISENIKHNYIQWKPIFYFNNPSKLENSTITIQYDLKNNQPLPNGIGCAFFDPKSTAYAFNVSFGLEGDEKNGYYYTQTNYSIWTFSVGLGAAPIEKMSFVVSLVIAVGFGLPALVIVVGLVAALVRKIRNSQYSEFREL